MANFLCRCGFAYKIGTEDGKQELEIIPGLCRGSFYERLTQVFSRAENEQSFRKLVVGAIVERMPLVIGYECPNCGRLAIEINGEISFWFNRESALNETSSITQAVEEICKPR